VGASAGTLALAVATTDSTVALPPVPPVAPGAGAAGAAVAATANAVAVMVALTTDATAEAAPATACMIALTLVAGAGAAALAVAVTALTVGLPAGPRTTNATTLPVSLLTSVCEADAMDSEFVTSASRVSSDPPIAPRSSLAGIDHPLAGVDTCTTSMPIHATSLPPPSDDPAVKDGVSMVDPATVSLFVALAPMGVVASNSPAGTLNAHAVHCSDADGVTVIVPEVAEPLAFHQNTLTTCAVPPKLPLIVLIVSLFGPLDGSVCVTFASEHRQTTIRSPSACAGREMSHEVVAVLFPLSVQSAASMSGAAMCYSSTVE
jgi:hypothetical protein